MIRPMENNQDNEDKEKGQIPRQLYLLRYSEIGLKGKNRIYFERKLIENLKVFLKNQGVKGKFLRLHSRILADCELGQGKNPRFERVFGISSYSPVETAPTNLDKISQKALSMLRNHAKTTTFRVSSRRLTKDFHMTSPEIDKELGARIVETKGWKVSLRNPELELGIEVDGKTTYLFTETFKCFAGLPVGVEGNVFSLVTGDEFSHLAAILLAKRGCSIVPVCLESLDEKRLLLLPAFSIGAKPILLKDLEEIRTLSDEKKCKALVVPDTLSSLQDYNVDLPVFRPLIGLSDEEVSLELEKYKSVL
ncbi:hypothetical protein JW711_00140 [Candidatus Woesearchaeota archaeon]|nr:hypothetical protein [Candidatus Woesearchaeota archaeon]